MIPEDHREALVQYMALPLEVRQEVHELEYEQFNTNNMSYLGLQFFLTGLHPNIQLEVIKSGTSDLYKAFKTAQACKKALKNKKIHAANSAKVNELELDAVNNPEEREAVKAVRRQFAQKRMFSSNNGSAYQPRAGGSSNGNFSNGATYNGNNCNGNENCSAQPQSGQ